MYPLVDALILIFVQVVQRMRRDVSHFVYRKPREGAVVDHGRTVEREAQRFLPAATSHCLGSKKEELTIMTYGGHIPVTRRSLGIFG